jgi:adenylate cyclase
MRDAVNVASRLEGRTKGPIVGILVGEVTRNRVKDVVFREIDRIRVKGKEEAVTNYEPLDSGGGRSRAAPLGAGVASLSRPSWNEAEMILREAHCMSPAPGK